MAKYLEDKRRRLQGQQTEPVQKQPIQYTPKAAPAVQTQAAVPAPAEKQTYTVPKTPAQKQNATPAPVQAAVTPAQTAGSDVVAQAQQLLGEQLGGYQSQYGSQITDLVAQLQNRPAFEYDVNTDPLYLQLRDIWKQDGLMAMEDTMGRAAQLTGGYGNSHAQMLGQQVYNDHMRGVTEMVPQLREQARADYDAENADLLQRLSLLMDQDEQEYARWMDELNRQRYEEELAYSREQDSYSREQESYDRLAELIASTGYVPTAEELAAAGMTADQAKAWKGYYDKSAGGSSGGSGGSSGGSTGKNSSGGGSYAGQGAGIDDYDVDWASVEALGIENITPAQLDALVNQGEVEEYVENGVYKYRWKKQNRPPAGGSSGSGRGNNRDKWQSDLRD